MELVALGLSGLCLGAGMGAAKQRAPRGLAAAFYVLSFATFLVVPLTLLSGR